MQPLQPIEMLPESSQKGREAHMWIWEGVKRETRQSPLKRAMS